MGVGWIFQQEGARGEIFHREDAKNAKGLGGFLRWVAGWGLGFCQG